MALLARQRVFPARRFELRVFAFRPRKQLRHQGFLPLPPLILNRCVSDLPPPDSLNQPWVKVLGRGAFLMSDVSIWVYVIYEERIMVALLYRFISYNGIMRSLFLYVLMV